MHLALPATFVVSPVSCYSRDHEVNIIPWGWDSLAISPDTFFDVWEYDSVFVFLFVARIVLTKFPGYSFFLENPDKVDFFLLF